MKRLILALIFLFAVAGVSFAVNTTAIGTSQTVIQITGLDADWDWPTDMAAAGMSTGDINSARIKSIIFYPSATSDRMLIHDGGVDAAVIFDSGIVTGSDDPRIKYYDEPVKGVSLVIDISDCTLDTAANAKVLIYIELR